MAQELQMLQLTLPSLQNGDEEAQYQKFINPENFYYSRWWKWFLVVASFYFCFISTLLNTFSEPPTMPLYVEIPIISFASLAFLIDIGISFFVYWDEFAVAETNGRRIVVNAAITIIVRLLLLVPFEVVGTHPVLRMFALVFRFFYSTRIHHMFSELEEDEKISFTVVGIAKMMWVCFLVCHYGGCVFYIMATFHANITDTWFSLVDTNFVKFSSIKKYVTSIYYAVISFTTVGYGDLHPIYMDEKIFSVIYLLVNFGLIVYVGTTIVYLVVPDAGPLGKYRARRVRVLDFCQQIELSDELYNEVSSHLKAEYQSQSQPSEENGILESLPITVKRKIVIALSNAVQNNNLFTHLSNPIQFQLIQAMESVFFPASTSIVLQNEAPTFLYFVVRGSVDLNYPNDPDIPVRTVTPGEVFGEICLFFNTPQVFAATTTEWSHLLMLDRMKLLNILESCVNDTSRMLSAYIEDLRANNNNPYMKRVLLDFERRAKTGGIDLPISLWFAISRGYDKLFDKLAEKHPEPNGCDALGQTAMHLAVSSNDIQKVTELLKIGANPNIKDLAGNVPLWIALSKEYRGVAKVLQSNGATLTEEE